MDNKKHIDPRQKIIGQRLNTALAIRNVSQKALAEKLSITDNTVSYYCSGARTPKTVQLVEIANYLQISTDYLLGRVPNLTPDPEKSSVCDYTGLSESSLFNLLMLKQGTVYQCDNGLSLENLANTYDSARPEMIPEAVNLLISSQFFPTLISNIANYMDAYHALMEEAERNKLLKSKASNETSVVELNTSEDENKDLFDLNMKKDLFLFRIQEAIKKIISTSCENVKTSIM